MLRDLHRRLRPLGIADILDETAELYRSNFLLLIGISAVIWAPLSLVMGALRLGQRGSQSGLGSVEMALNMLIESLVTGALTLAISERYLERPASTSSSYRTITRRPILLPLIGAMILKHLVVLGPLMAVAFAAPVMMLGADTGKMPLPHMIAVVLGTFGLMCITGFWAAFTGVKLSVVEPVVVLERRGAWRSLVRSWDLLRGHSLRAFWILLIALGFVTLITLIMIGPTTFVITMNTMAHQDPARWVMALHTVLTALAQVLMGPVAAAVVILLYYDLRIRKEGFDLELLAKDLDESTRRFEAGGASSLPQENPAPPREGQP